LRIVSAFNTHPERLDVQIPISCSALPQGVATPCVLWLLLTSVRSACFLKQSYEVTPHSVQISPGKNAIFLSIYLPHLLPFAFGSKDFDLECSLIQRTLALYEIRVPQAGDLPPTSFRFDLTVDILVFS
jgi:hypothetical protein